MTTGKTVALTIWTFVGKVMSLLFNMLSRFVIVILPRSKKLIWMILFPKQRQRREQNRCIENKCMDTKREGGDGVNWRIGVGFLDTEVCSGPLEWPGYHGSCYTNGLYKCPDWEQAHIHTSWETVRLGPPWAQMVGTDPRDPVFQEGCLLGRKLIHFCLNENFLWISVPRLHCTFQNNILLWTSTRTSNTSTPHARSASGHVALLLLNSSM